jgi:flagellar basal-body rod protein FlgC
MTLQDSMAIAGMGMDTHVERMQVHSANIANIGTPGYVRQIPVLVENSVVPFDTLLNKVRDQGAAIGMMASPSQGVQMLGTVEDTTPGKKVYQPEHPLADDEGFVTLSNTNPLGDMADAMVSSRMYEANVSLYNIVKTMANKALDIGSGR